MLPSSQAADFECDFKGISRHVYGQEKFAPVDLRFGEFVKGDVEKEGPKTAKSGHGGAGALFGQGLRRPKVGEGCTFSSPARSSRCRRCSFSALSASPRGTFSTGTARCSCVCSTSCSCSRGRLVRCRCLRERRKAETSEPRGGQFRHRCFTLDCTPWGWADGLVARFQPRRRSPLTTSVWRGARKSVRHVQGVPVMRTLRV